MSKKPLSEYVPSKPANDVSVANFGDQSRTNDEWKASIRQIFSTFSKELRDLKAPTLEELHKMEDRGEL